MKIEKDRVVRFHYTVSEVGQEPLESSKEREPLAILIGHGNIIPGLEKAMEGREAGESFGVDVPSADAYGEKREGLSQRVPKKHFGNQRLVPGMQVVLNTNFGPRAVTIEKVGMSVVDVSGWPTLVQFGGDAEKSTRSVSSPAWYITFPVFQFAPIDGPPASRPIPAGAE